MKIHYSPGPESTNTLSTDQLRSRFLISGLFEPGAVTAHYTDLDRMIVGAAVPTTSPLDLPNAKELGTSFFLERREIGILNLGSEGLVRVGGKSYPLENLDCLYIGQGEKDVLFVNGSSGRAQFFFISTPAHANHPTAMVSRANAQTDPIGDPAKANRRRINKLIHPDGIKSCQLVMGFTEFEPGSVWNTMPPHTHSRRTEVYLYFDVADNLVFHFLGEPHATRHLVVRDREAVLSPAWSVHCGAGTGAYRFVWAMGGGQSGFRGHGCSSPRKIEIAARLAMPSYLEQKFGLGGKVALVTGSSRGLGRAMARALMQAGADVIVNGREPAALSPVVSELSTLRPEARAHAIPADLGDRTDVQRLIDRAIEWQGHLDILVNNAGIIKRSPAVEHSDVDWDLVLRVNLDGVFAACRAAGKHMLARGAGKIVNIASLLTFFGGITVPGYAASKGAVGQLTKALSNEWAGKGVNVNAIAPGYMRTDNTAALQADPVRAREILSRIPANRWGEPGDLEGAVVFLASSASDYLSGHILAVDGGWCGR